MIICLWIFGKCTSLWSLWSTLWNVSEELSIVSIPLKTVERAIKTLTIFCFKRSDILFTTFIMMWTRTKPVERVPLELVFTVKTQRVSDLRLKYLVFLFLQKLPLFYPNSWPIEAFPQIYIFLPRFLPELKIYFFSERLFCFATLPRISFGRGVSLLLFFTLISCWPSPRIFTVWPAAK